MHKHAIMFIKMRNHFV